MKTLKHKKVAWILLAPILVGGVIMGGIPFALSALIALAIRKSGPSYCLSLGLAAGLTLYVATYPETLRFGGADLKIHNYTSIRDTIGITPSMIYNLLMAYLGVAIVISAIEWFKQGREGTREGTR